MDHARIPHLLVAVRLNEPVMDKRGKGQTGVDDQASVAACSALADVSPSDAGSVTEENVRKPQWTI